MRDIDEEIQELEGFRVMAQTYEEIAAMRMRRIKNSVLRNREFLTGITSIFARVKYSYKEMLEKLLKAQGVKNKEELTRNIDKANFTKKNGKDVLVLLSSNTGLYGDIIGNVFEYFAEQVDSGADVVVIGKLGRMMFEQRFPNREYTYYDLSDNAQDPEKVSEIIEKLSEYENIVVFHGKFKDVLEQVPSQTYVSGDKVNIESREDMQEIRCIFEPTLQEVFTFFETEIKSTLFEQALYESSLSKFTSRMVSLDSATANAATELKKAVMRRNILHHRESDKEKNTVLSSVMFCR